MVRTKNLGKRKIGAPSSQGAERRPTPSPSLAYSPSPPTSAPPPFVQPVTMVRPGSSVVVDFPFGVPPQLAGNPNLPTASSPPPPPSSPPPPSKGASPPPATSAYTKGETAGNAATGSGMNKPAESSKSPESEGSSSGPMSSPTFPSSVARQKSPLDSDPEFVIVDEVHSTLRHSSRRKGKEPVVEPPS